MAWAIHIYSVTSISSVLKGQLETSFFSFLPFSGPQVETWEPNVKLRSCLLQNGAKRAQQTEGIDSFADGTETKETLGCLAIQ